MINIIYLVGPSASGKDYIKKYLKESLKVELKEEIKHRNLEFADVVYLSQCTTRLRRENELASDYEFMTDDQFSRNIKDNLIIESREYIMKDKNGDPFRVRYGTKLFDNIKDYKTFKENEDDYNSSNIIQIGCGTIESCLQIKEYIEKERFTSIKLIPVYIHTDEAKRLTKAIERSKDSKETLVEVCRRFITDTDQFTHKAIKSLGNSLMVNNHYDDIKNIIDSILVYYRIHKL